MKRQRGRPRTFNLDARDILRYHRRGMTLGEIGAAYGVTGAAVSYRLRQSNLIPLRPGRRTDRDYSHLITAAN